VRQVVAVVLARQETQTDNDRVAMVCHQVSTKPQQREAVAVLVVLQLVRQAATAAAVLEITVQLAAVRLIQVAAVAAGSPLAVRVVRVL
tara:strand:+ start:674 stop:940 length:267 start_codon:yes stop_codon:yes gene_type:complete